MTYNANFNSPPYHDIRRADLSLFPPFDICVGGFPCQDFSGLGEQKGLEGSKGALFYEVIRVLEHCRPPMVLLENVKGLQTMQDGKVLEVVRGELERLGYHVTTGVMNASCFVPQYRPRLYICGFLDAAASQAHRFPDPPVISPPRVVNDILHTAREEPFLDMYKLTTSQWQTVRKSKTSRKYGLDKRLVAPQDRMADTLIRSYRESRQSIAQFVCDYKDDLIEEDKREQMDQLDQEKRRDDQENGQGTLATQAKGGCIDEIDASKDHYNSQVKSTGGAVLTKNTVSRPRWFTPRECARLMGFPDSFLLPPGGLPAYEQLGNAVVPPVITILVSSMFAAKNKSEGADKCGDKWNMTGLQVACQQVVESLPPARALEMRVQSSISHPFLKHDNVSLSQVMCEDKES
jgi:DNA (cytosine-5)-methyltransferase 1